MEELEFEEILTYLATSVYPDSIKSKDSRSNWRKKCRPFTYCKDQLYYNHKKYGALLVVKGSKEKKRIIETCHMQHNGRHHGINRTLKQISTNYYWKTIARDVITHIKMECQNCIEQVSQQASNTLRYVVPPQGDTAGVRIKSKEKIVDKAMEQIGLDVIGNILEPNMQSQDSSAFKSEAILPQPSMQQQLVLRDHIMAQCGLDVVGPLTETHRGKRYVAVLTDCITKWVEAAALTEFTTEAVGDFLGEVVCRHGGIEEVVTRHDHRDFCARLTDRLCSTLSLVIRRLTPLPALEAGGYSEPDWYNNLICGALVKYTQQNQYYWDMYLPQVILAYRTFHQNNTLASPFQLLYDRPSRLPPIGVTQPSDGGGHADEQEALIQHINNYIKALSNPAPPEALPITSQPSDRLTPPYVTSDTPTPLPGSTANTPQSHTQQPPTQVLASFAQTVQSQNTTNQLKSADTTPQQTSQSNAAAIYTISNCVAPHTINNMVAVHNVTNSLNTQGLQASTVPILSNHNLHTNTSSAPSHVLTAPTVSAATTAATPHTSMSNTEAAGHMVMIHTDGGKAYTDSFYVICQQ